MRKAFDISFFKYGNVRFQNEQTIHTVLESGVKPGKLKTWAF